MLVLICDSVILEITILVTFSHEFRTSDQDHRNDLAKLFFYPLTELRFEMLGNYKRVL